MPDRQKPYCRHCGRFHRTWEAADACTCPPRPTNLGKNIVRNHADREPLHRKSGFFRSNTIRRVQGKE